MKLFHDAKNGAGIRRAPTEPRRNREVFLQRDPEAIGARHLAQRLCHQIVERVVETARELAHDRHGILRRASGCQHVPRIDEGEQRLELMIAIVPPPANMQCQVDLGIRGFDMSHATTPRHCERSQTIPGVIARIAASLSPSQ